ncbi:MAG: FGGY family carbohydrate kinase, partial [Propionicimonas sp.]|nr:FGGY family carbohydrate kinase [Propionicimonas sp.]
EYPLLARGGRLEADPRTYRDGVRRGARQVLAQAGGRRVVALTFTTQGETLIPVDAHGRALGPAIVWLDDRAAAEAADLRRAIEPTAFYATTGLPTLDGTVPLAKARHLLGTLPELTGQGARLLFVEDYLLRWLTGRTVSHRSLQTSSGWFDLHADDYWDAALALAGISRRLLPELVGCGEPIGRVLPEAARELGLQPDVLVVAGAMDQAAAALGAGVDPSGRIGVSFGTALVATAATTAPVTDPGCLPTTYRHALDGGFLVLLIEPTGGALLRWLRDLLVPYPDTGSPGYADLDDLAGALPPGSEGVLALPFFQGGCSDRNTAPGGFLGLTLGSGRGHLARSLMEAASYALRDLLGSLAGLGMPATELITSGGGSRSPLWQSIAADVCGVPLTPLPSGEAASAGAALLAGWGSGLVRPGTDPRPRDRAVAVLPDPLRPYEPHYAAYRRTVDALVRHRADGPVRDYPAPATGPAPQPTSPTGRRTR